VNVVTDSIEKNSLLGGVATALIISTKFANSISASVRIITRHSPAVPKNYYNILEVSEIEAPDEVIFYSDYDRDVNGKKNFKLDIGENDVFIATSWWSAQAIRSSLTVGKRFFYIIQEVETFFYPQGDEHYFCSRVMKDQEIDFIVNSEWLYEYFNANEPNVYERGIFFEPAFPLSLYHPSGFEQKTKYKLFFYARPNNPRNMYQYVLHILDKAISIGVLDTSEWDIYCAGQEVPELRFSGGYELKRLGLLDWKEYGAFLGTVDMSLSLMYTPHPSYIPFDVACSGGIALTNKFHNKQEFTFCKNVIMSDLDEDALLNAMEEAIRLAKDVRQRKANYEGSTIHRSWTANLEKVIQYMGEKVLHVQDSQNIS
jgi:hypothetical protein